MGPTGGSTLDPGKEFIHSHRHGTDQDQAGEGQWQALL
jgi:hypothetical protein